jgi:hypothetical protein
VGPSGGRCPGLKELLALTRWGQKGSWPSSGKPNTGRNEGCDRGYLWSSRRTRHRPTTSTRVASRMTGRLSVNRKRGRWLQLVGAPSSASPSRVGDAGNGYPASSWRFSGRIGVRASTGTECSCGGFNGESRQPGNWSPGGYS